MSNYKNLLISEPPLQVLPTLAVAIGLNEAIIIQQLHYWVENTKTDGFIDKDGTKWIFNTYEQWHENFPFWSVHTIQRIFLNLEKMEIIISAQLSRDTHDKTKYYRIDYAKLEASNMPNWHYGTPHIGVVDSAKLASCLNESETTTENTSEIQSKGSISSKEKTKLLENLPMDWKIAAGMSDEEVARAGAKERREYEVACLYESAMGYNPLGWWSDKKLTRLLRFLMDKTPEQVKAFAAWSKREYSSLTPTKARQYPDMVIECWPQASQPQKDDGYRTL